MARKKRSRSTRLYLSSRNDLNIQVKLTPTDIQKDPPTGLVRHGRLVVWEIENKTGADTFVVIGHFLRLSPTSEGEPVPDWPFMEPPPWWAIAAVPKGKPKEKRTKVRLHVKDKHPGLTGLHRYSYSIGCPHSGIDPEIVIEWP